MKESTKKEKILKKLRDAQLAYVDKPVSNIDMDSPIHEDFYDDLNVVFAESFVRNNGHFVYCEGIQETIDSIRFFMQNENWDSIFCADKMIQKILNTAGVPYTEDPNELIVKKIGFSSCVHLIARSGSIMVSSTNAYRKMFSSVKVLVFIATVDQVLPDLKAAYKLIKESKSNSLPSMISTLTGVSTCTDIEGNLFAGLGPQKIFLFLVDSKTK